MVVELAYRVPIQSAGGNAQRASSLNQRSVYLGWTGLSSKARPVALPVGGRDSARQHDVGVVELDVALAGTLGLADGQKVTVTIHLDPPLATTVEIEPATPEDWELVELHAGFLEANLLSQIRALPNPAFAPAPGLAVEPHPLTLHLSPTSTANIKILSLSPQLPSDAPFARISPDAEVLVAPKLRTRTSMRSAASHHDTRSVASSTGTAVRQRRERRPAIYLRGVERRFCEDWFDSDPATAQELAVWVDADILLSREFRGVTWVAVSLVRQGLGLARPSAASEGSKQQKQDADVNSSHYKAATKVVARILPWDEPPDGQTVALSTPLTAALGCQGMVGGVVKVEPAPSTLAKDAVQGLKIYPFATSTTERSAGLRFGGESRAEQEESVRRIKQLYVGTPGAKGLLAGPVTDGLVLGVFEGTQAVSGWAGGVVRLDPPRQSQSSGREPVQWIHGGDRQLPMEVMAPIPRPAWLRDARSDELVPKDAIIVGIDLLLAKLTTHLGRLTSVLLTGSLGSGKTSVARLAAQRLRDSALFHVSYFSCRQLANKQGRTSSVKQTLEKVFMGASWGARLGGKALVVLDDVDRLCPAETELVVGNNNERSRQLSELLCSIARQYCRRDNGVALLLTAQGKDALHSVIVGGHVVSEMVDLGAPDKDTRRLILETLARHGTISPDQVAGDADSSRPPTADGSVSGESMAWMDDTTPQRRRSEGFYVDDDVDFLDVAAETDGFMPADLRFLVSRARSEALMRAVASDPAASSRRRQRTTAEGAIPVSRVDFDNALRGFTPAALRNVALQQSTTTFASIGGLRATRQTLLETLEYPTKYAPLFAKVPLRLRSGLLLYGYPGCGKTLLASAVAGECGLNFISVKGPEILSKYIGSSEKAVRDLFERAQAARPCVLFFDEFDSIAPRRGHDSTGVTDRVVNQLLTQMDGAEGLQGVYVLAATSRPDLIDPALLRPGRLDKSLLCDFPSREDRRDVLRALARKVRLAPELLVPAEQSGEPGRDELAAVAPLDAIADEAEGFSGADLQALLSNAQLAAIHEVLEHDAWEAGSGGRGSSANGTASNGTAVLTLANGKKLSASASAPGNDSGRGSTGSRYVQFRYGADDADSGIGSRALGAAETAAITAKLEGLKLARRRAKEQARGGRSDGVSAEMESKDASGASSGTGEATATIRLRHLRAALAETRPSIGAAERARLAAIYREFIVGRSGEMRSGEGSHEAGTRTSLM